MSFYLHISVLPIFTKLIMVSFTKSMFRMQDKAESAYRMLKTLLFRVLP